MIYLISANEKACATHHRHLAVLFLSLLLQSALPPMLQPLLQQEPVIKFKDSQKIQRI